MPEKSTLVLLFVGGALARVVLPYLQVWFTSHKPFQWRKVLGHVIGAAILIIPAITGLANEVAEASVPGAVVIGWGAADIGRQGQKVIDHVRGGEGGLPDAVAADNA